MNVRLLEARGEGTGENAVKVAAPKTMYVRPRPEGIVSIFVGNLPYDITEAILKKLFTGCGDIKVIRFCEDINTKEFRGFGYVQFYEGASCEKAFAMNGTAVMGRPIRIDYDDDSKANLNADSSYGGSAHNALSHAELQAKLKKGLCHKFQQGLCDRGNECKFAHVTETECVPGEAVGSEAAVVEEIIPEAPVILNGAEEDAPICQNFEKGKCKRGNNCRFRHMSVTGSSETEASRPIEAASVVEESNTPDISICVNFLQGNCYKGKSCRFAHPEDDEETREAKRSSDYQRRFQNVCYNWQKSASCARGDSCPFNHTVSAAPTKVKKSKKDIVYEDTQGTKEEKIVEVVVVEEKCHEVEEMEEPKKKKSKKKKVSKEIIDTDAETPEKKKKKKKRKHSENEEEVPAAIIEEEEKTIKKKKKHKKSASSKCS